mgnify:FL=1
MINKTLGNILLRILPNKKKTYNFSKILLNRYNNNKNWLPHKNGEFNILKKFLLSNISDKIFFDIGCNIGDFSKYLLKNNYKDKIYLFDVINSLDKNIVENDKVKFTETLFWNKHEKIKFNINKNEKNSGTNSPFDMNKIGYATENNQIEINSSTLDYFIQENKIKKIDYLKIDTEGSEYRVLKGASDNLKKDFFKFIHLEYGHAAMADRVYIKDIYDLLAPLGMHMYVIIPEGLRKLDYSPYLENEYDYINLFFCSDKNLKLLDVKPE